MTAIPRRLISPATSGAGASGAGACVESTMPEGVFAPGTRRERLSYFPNKGDVATAANLVQKWGADVWKLQRTSNIPDNHLPLHAAAMPGAFELVAFFVDECNMPVDTATQDRLMTPLHAACLSNNCGSDVLPLVQYLVENKGASRTTTFLFDRKNRETAV